MNARTAINAYTNVGLESSVISADPHRLISMLYQGALLAIANAKSAISRNNIAAKGEAISQAMMIINDGLNASLDKTVGGELSLNLGSLYDYMSSRLLQASAQNDVAALDEVSALLVDLKGAWEAIRPNNARLSENSAPTAKIQPAARMQNSVQQLYGKA